MTGRETFEALIDVRGARDCWPWTGKISGGYPVFPIDGVRVSASRIAWSLAEADKTGSGEIPDEHVIVHECEDRLCMNPRHLCALPRGWHV